MGNFNFKELRNYKNTIMMKLLSNEKLVKALVNNQSNFLDYGVPEDVTELIYSQIFPYRKNTNTITETNSYITMAFDNFRPLNGSKEIKNGRIVFFIIVHNDLIRTDEGLRTDYILSEIDETFNDYHIGIGGLELIDAGDFQLSESSNYMAICVMYKITDFQIGIKDR